MALTLTYLSGHHRIGEVFAIHRDLTGVGNVGGGTDNLISYAMVASLLSVDNRGLRITAWGTKANNANPKTLAMLFGGTTILTNALNTGAAGRWKIVAEVFRTSEDNQKYYADLTGTDTDAEQGTATENDGAIITIKCTGTVTDGGGGINNDDIKQEGLLVEVIN